MAKQGKRADKPVFFFGIWEPLLGEYDGDQRHPEIFDVNGKAQESSFFEYLPWNRVELSGGLLSKRNVLDKYTSTLYWWYSHNWHCWCWWDRSAKDEPGTASVFLAYNYPLLWRDRALSQCLRSFPTILLRQSQEFELHGKTAHRNGKLGDL